MKKIYILFLIIAISPIFTYSQGPGDVADFDIRIVEDWDNWPGYVVVQIRANYEATAPDANTKIEKLQFGIKWNRDIVNGNKLDFDFVCDNQGIYNPYQLMQEDHPLPHNVQGWDFRNFELSPAGINQTPPYGAWVAGEWQDIAVLRVFRRTPGGQVIPNGYFYILQEGEYQSGAGKGYEPIFTLKNGGSIEYMMNVPVGDPENYESTELPVPTGTDMQYTWVGGKSGTVDGIAYDGYSWNYARNWDNGCGGGEAEVPPGEFDDCLIPSGRTYYPRYPRPNNYTSDTAKCNSLWVKSAPGEAVAQIQWMQEENYSGSGEVILNVYGDMDVQRGSSISVYKKGVLEIGNQIIYDTFPEYKSDLKLFYAFLKIYSGGFVRVLMDTDVIGSASKLSIYSGPDGPGNFKNFGDITYALNGSSSVQTFMKNSAPVGEYFFHTVGPTVYNQDYHEWGGPTGTGVALRNFDLDILQTFAYQWQEHNGQWLNVYPYPYPIATATGLMLSDTTGDDNSFTQTGELLTGDISVQLNHTSGNPSDYDYLELISNPYPSAVSWESLYARNISKVFPVIYMYNADAQEWGDYNATTEIGTNGVSELIQVGQGFFVKTQSVSQFNFTDDDKRFSSFPLRSNDDSDGSLRITINGNGMKDEMVINFMQEATTGYDELFDTRDWGSYYADATQIYSIVAGEKLSVNSLPFHYDQMTSVPVNIEAKAQATYELTFSNFESLINVDIWLEDTYDEGNLIKISEDNSIYTFFGSPNLQADRFNIHFNASFLPNAIEEFEEKLIKVYSANSDLYIINNSKEIVKEVSVYNIMGQEISRTDVPEQNNYKIKIYGATAYYVVRIHTNKNIYTEKVFIKGN